MSIENGKENILTHFPDLIPANPYPRQMLQGILALEHLIELGYKPSEVSVCHIKIINQHLIYLSFRSSLVVTLQAAICLYRSWLIFIVPVP
jgi:hypothetical protein